MNKKIELKKVYNPITHKYYKVFQKTSKSKNNKQIKGLWNKKELKSMNKYIGKPTREIKINLSEFDKSKTLNEVITELERQDRLFNGFLNKSYAFENKMIEHVL